MLLLEPVLVAIAHVHQRRHVDLVERGQDRRGRLRLNEALGHPLAQARHRHALLRPVGERREVDRRLDFRKRGPRRRRGRCGSRRRSRARLRARRERAEHVALGHAAVLAGPGDLSGRQTGVGHQLRRGGHRHPRCSGAAAAAAFGYGRRRARGRSRGPLAFRVDRRDDLARHHRGAIALDDLAERPARRRRHFQHDLVGLDLDQDLVGDNRVAGLLLPLQQRGFGDRFRQLRYLDFNYCHFLPGSDDGRERFRVSPRESGGRPPGRALDVPERCARPERHLFSTRPLSFPNAVSINAFCCSTCLA